jgi:isopentenyldiphosphate isomerase
MVMDEVLEVVDKQNKVIGTEKRSVIFKKRLLRRGVALMILKGDDEVLLAKRPPDKDINPDCWSFSVSGHVKPGESPDDAIGRETREELGRKVDAEYVRLFRPEKEYQGYFLYVYISRLGVGPGKPGFDVRESTKARFWRKSEILDYRNSKEKFSPHFLWVFGWLVEKGKI